MSDKEFEKKLSELRGEIDEVDAELLSIIGRRLKISVAIGTLKSRNQRPILDAQREDQLIGSRVGGGADHGIPAPMVRATFAQILSSTREVVAVRVASSQDVSKRQ